MNIKAENYGHAVILVLDGDLNEDSLASFKTAVDHHLLGKDVIDIILNLEQVGFLDSAAMEYLLDLHERLAERLGQVKLVKCGEHIQKILEITRLQGTFETYQDTPEAVKALQG